MPKEIIVHIGYDDYTLCPEAFAVLAEIANEAIKVHRPDYSAPWVRNPENADGTFIRNVVFEACDLTPPVPPAEMSIEEAADNLNFPPRGASRRMAAAREIPNVKSQYKWPEPAPAAEFAEQQRPEATVPHVQPPGPQDSTRSTFEEPIEF